MNYISLMTDKSFIEIGETGRSIAVLLVVCTGLPDA